MTNKNAEILAQYREMSMHQLSQEYDTQIRDQKSGYMIRMLAIAKIMRDCKVPM